MKTVLKLSLLTLTMALVGCNEKVSPELEQGSATTAGDGDSPTIIPDEYYFKLSNTAPTILNYKLHKSGSGNVSAPCEVRGTAALSNDNFRGAPATYDISCFLEAEELSLTAGGLSFEIESSPNTCEFIAYSPFSYYSWMPGTSTGTYTEVTCMNTDTTQTHIDLLANAAILDSTANYAGCDEIISNAPLLSAVRLTASKPITDQDLCLYDYTDSFGPNCDEGTITINDYQVTYDVAARDAAAEAARTAAQAPLQSTYSDTTDDDGAGPDDGLEEISSTEQADIDVTGQAAYDAVVAAWLPTAKTVPREHKCGGKAINCIGGPIREHSALANATRGSIITTAEYDKVMTIGYEYDNLIEVGLPNWNYANYRRDLSSSQIDYGTSEHNYVSLPVVPHNATYLGAWSDPALNKIFEPNVIERYARNLLWNQTRMIDTTINSGDGINTIYERASVFSDTYYGRPLAADPFVGMGSAYYTSPFYTFYCLDPAMDIKARIRLAVRDWDRTFPSTSDLELITDIHLGSSARQDLQSYDEDTSSTDDFNEFNDISDWDDNIWMERYLSGGILIYRPQPDASLIYPDGYFNPNYFPNPTDE
ncbi:MAG: hypothetical protein ACLGHN_00610 [Bacteriovoracia bacterium]